MLRVAGRDLVMETGRTGGSRSLPPATMMTPFSNVLALAQAPGFVLSSATAPDISTRFLAAVRSLADFSEAPDGEFETLFAVFAHAVSLNNLTRAEAEDFLSDYSLISRRYRVEFFERACTRLRRVVRVAQTYADEVRSRPVPSDADEREDHEMRVAEAEATETFPREVFRTLGKAGLLGLPYDEELGGGGVSYEVYLQVLEEIASVWTSVGVGVSVHAPACFGLATRGTDEQRRRWLPEMLGGELLGAYCLSEPQAGSDPNGMRTRAVREGDEYVVTGTKAWTTHGGHADFYTVMARTGEGRGDISCFLVPADAEGLSADVPERKMGLTGSATATMRLEKAARVGDALALSADIVKEAEGKSPFTIKTAIRDASGEVLSEADFDYVLVPQAKFRHVAGLDRLPEHYVRHFGVA